MSRAPIIRAYLGDDEIAVDNFAGGGGASSGIAWAIGRSPDIAINHDPQAIAMHAANHPETRHYVENVWAIDPRKAAAGKRVGLAWFSPTCTHFSKAKGQPLGAESVKIRGLAWVAVRWAAAVRPRIICLENVEEFLKWGPLDRATHKPVKSKIGATFRSFVRKLEKLGYVVEHRLLRACDYGAPTTRRRLFLVARCDGKPIVWPEPTHGPARPQPHRSAAECIDWSVPCPSIFERDKPLADKTLARIARGIRKFVLDNPRPFIVPPAYGDKGGTDVRVNSADEPLRTVCGNRGGHAIVVPYLVHRGNGERAGQAPRIYDAQKPLGTVVAQGQKHAACVALLIKHFGDRPTGGWAGGQSLEKPVGTVTARDHHSLAVAHLVRYNGDRREGEARGAEVSSPLPTLDTSNRYALVASHLVKLRGTSDAHVDSSASAMTEPVPTVSASGTHIAAVSAFLVRYNGQSVGQLPEQPIGTLDTTDRYGLVTVTVAGEEYVIADIGMRMLTPRELYAAQGFPPDYKIDPLWNGKPLTKTAQIRMVGNSVPPVMSEVIARAQLAVPRT